MFGWVFNLLEKKFIAHLHKKKAITLTKENLTLSFYDLDGNGYYKFPKGLDLPMNRLAKLQDYLMWLSKGIDPAEYKKALEFAESGLEGGIKDGKGLSKIAFIINELKTRPEMVVHDELFYNILAVQIIRQDESVTDFSNDIQMQKVAAFKLLDKQDDSFFLNTQEYLEPLGLSNTTRDQLTKLLRESQILRATLEKMVSSQ